ncbi:MAG TPA: elongation factor G [Clostridiales bacterium]|jgi:elongation factor G|nr:elongation factor G [Clostridiales bacterium]
MATITTQNIRNICLLGHGGSGKTSLVEAMLYYTKGTDRLGKVIDGNTVCDYDPEETKRKFSLSASIAPIVMNHTKLNFMDTPGYLDFVGEVKQALRVCENALIVVNAKSGVEVGAELAWEHATEANASKAFFINRMDEDDINFDAIIDSLHALFGTSVCPMFIPFIENHKTAGYVDLINEKAYSFDKNGVPTEISIPASVDIERYQTMLFEALAETSEELMEKYFSGETFTPEEIAAGLHHGLITHTIAPVICGSAATLAGIDYLLHVISSSFVNPIDKETELDIDNNPVNIEENGPASIFVFKTVADSFGKMSFFKVMNGTMKRDDVLKNLSNGQVEKFSHIYTIKGKKQTEVDELVCGDIGVIVKLAATSTNDTLRVSGTAAYKQIAFPEPFLAMGISPKAKGDEDKISSGISRMLEEDLTVRYVNNAETKQLLIYGLGEMHIDVAMSKLKNRNGVSVDLTPEKIAYRETIKKTVQVQGKHKKQSGGHGQYGDVRIEFSPGDEPGLTFTETIFGGSVPKNFHPAVEKGLLESMQKGVLAGFPVVNLKANLYDGSYHDVDSSEMAFKLAAGIAFREGLPKANPVILEPIGTLKVLIPDTMMGDVIGDLNKRRGKVLGMEASETKKGYQVVEAEVPQAEMGNYTIQLRAMSQGRGSFVYRFDRYAEAPANIAQKIIETAKAEKEAEE